MKYTELSTKQQTTILEQVSAQSNLDLKTIEKDWWVTQVLKAIFALPYSKEISFKGGTSLSKGWNLIERFSEDIDMGINREFLGFVGDLSKSQISDRLRRKTCSFVREQMQFDIKTELLKLGIDSGLFEVVVNITPITTTDPEMIYVNYKSILPLSEYINSSVKIEVSGRSMHEPVVDMELQSIIDKQFPTAKFSEAPFRANVVIPERTFLEKVFLIHEEFAKPQTDIRTERMSRHIYDIYRIMQTPVAEKAIDDEHLYKSVIEHRRKFIGLKGFDYDTLYSDTLSLEIPESVYSLWKTDYEKMQRNMIYGQSPTFEILVTTLQDLQLKIRAKGYTK